VPVEAPVDGLRTDVEKIGQTKILRSSPQRFRRVLHSLSIGRKNPYPNTSTQRANFSPEGACLPLPRNGERAGERGNGIDRNGVN